jgi:lipopolysaccharide/colanic/teichoic acid biosynthesis glycosyltransferase
LGADATVCFRRGISFRARSDFFELLVRTEEIMFSTAQRLTAQVAVEESEGFLSEDKFATRLCLERKRSERSGHSFMLALFNLAIPDPVEGRTLRGLVVPALCPVVRDTDVVGWYEQDSVIGVIFTHLQDVSRVLAKSALEAKLGRVLGAAVPAPSLQRLRISYHFFPESSGDAASKSNDAELDRGHGFRHASRGAHILKRTIDIVGSILLLLLFSPLFLVIAVLIKMGSKGPVLFRQTRLGQYGHAFTFLKFRSMYVNNDSGLHRDYVSQLIAGADVARSDAASRRVFKIVDDPRVTSVGRILRKSSLDELPQFLNVLKGEMSLIGPRPPLPYEFERYKVWHRRRIMEVKPGISGLWQVSGRSKTTFDEMVRLDLLYARTWSIWLDLKILLQTPAAVISGDGAY